MLSIIIPTFNEEDVIEGLLTQLIAIEGLEIIVVDGGSKDYTIQKASRFTKKVFISERRGRASQMNIGASHATGNTMLFLHADSFDISASHISTIKRVINEGNCGGAFSLRINSSKLSLKMISIIANLRSKMLGITYGDQGIFIRRDIFLNIGGYRDMPILEDYDLFKRMAKKGDVVILNKYILTSPRRWEKYGVLFTTLRNTTIILLYLICKIPQIIKRQLSC